MGAFEINEIETKRSCSEKTLGKEAGHFGPGFLLDFHKTDVSVVPLVAEQ